MTDEFEWDAAKATANLRKHGVAFGDAQFVFNDAFAVHSFDVDAGYGERRMIGNGQRGFVDSCLHGAGRTNPAYIGAESHET